jgi:hypothetical protein
VFIVGPLAFIVGPLALGVVVEVVVLLDPQAATRSATVTTNNPDRMPVVTRRRRPGLRARPGRRPDFSGLFEVRMRVP